MKTTCPRPLSPVAFLLLFVSLGVISLFADDARTNVVTDFTIGQASFPHGDFIEITSVERAQDRMVVKGHYKLLSADQAELALYTTTSVAISVPTDPAQTMHISKGQGDFDLTHPNLVPGLNHVTMYSIPGGKPFAGIYFGNQEEAAEEGRIKLGYYQNDPAGASAAPYSGNAIATSGPNQVLLEYLGNPVEPPADLDPRYTKEGLIKAIQSAARNAGITPKKVAVDDSEYPFLLGVVCAGSDATTLKAEIKKMEGYAYSGSIGNDSNRDGRDTCNVFNIVPYPAQPSKDRQQIGRRLMLRQQVFYDRLIVQE